MPGSSSGEPSKSSFSRRNILSQKLHPRAVAESRNQIETHSFYQQCQCLHSLNRQSLQSYLIKITYEKSVVQIDIFFRFYWNLHGLVTQINNTKKNLLEQFQRDRGHIHIFNRNLLGLISHFQKIVFNIDPAFHPFKKYASSTLSTIFNLGLSIIFLSKNSETITGTVCT